MTNGNSCQTCKDRRIKCDGVKPMCGRCTKSRRTCVPVQETKHASFLIHNENRFASGKSKRPRGPRSSFVQQSKVDLKTKALASYLQYHLHVIANAPVTSGGLSECVSKWMASGRKDPMVDLALSSMALTVYANTHSDLAAREESSSEYHGLLQMVQQRIASVELPISDEKEIDACLLTMFLMGRYEGATQRHNDVNLRDAFPMLQSWSHHEGALAMLKVWYDNLRHLPVSEIVKQTRRGQLRSAILRSRIVPAWLLEGKEFGEIGIDLDYDSIAVRIILLRQSLACAQQKKDVPLNRVQELNEEAQDIERSLQNWLVQLSSDFRQKEHTFPVRGTLPRDHFFSRKAFSYADPGHAGVWSQFCGAKMLISVTRFRILDLGCPDMLTYGTYRQQRQECEKQIAMTADDLAAIVPFSLQQFRLLQHAEGHEEVVIKPNENFIPYMSSILVWPLTIAISIVCIPPAQRLWFGSQLVSIGKVTGDNVLLNANTEAWSISL